MHADDAVSRRGLLRAAAGATGAGAAVASTAGTAGAQQEYGGWLSDTSNYDGTTVDATGQSEVTISVGAEGNNGDFAFDPPAIHVDPGTTVVWEWTGNGGRHNVVAESGADFESELTDEQGHTFEQTFEEDALVKYFCRPHESLGMKGVVVVGTPPTPEATPTPADIETPGGTPVQARTPSFRVSIIGGLASLSLVAITLATLYLVLLGSRQDQREGEE
jgi:halocyanin-like protein